MTRLLLINPNISDSVSELIRAEAQRSAVAGHRGRSADRAVRRGLHRDALRGADRRLRRGAARRRAPRALRRGDRRRLRRPRPRRPARGAADARSPGLTEAALASACLLGQRFSIVAISQRIQRLVPRDRCRRTASAAGWPASARSTEPLADIGSVQDDQGERAAGARRALRRRGRRRRDRARRRAAGRPRAQRCAAACRCRWSTACRAPCAMPRRLVALQPGRAHAGSFAPPPVKPNRGLPPAIARAGCRPQPLARPHRRSALPDQEPSAHDPAFDHAPCFPCSRSPPPHSPRRRRRRRRRTQASRPSASRWPPA